MLEGWMTAQVLVKLSAKLAAEQQIAKFKHNEFSKLRFENDVDIFDQEDATLNPPDADGISNDTASMPQISENYHTVNYRRTHGPKRR